MCSSDLAGTFSRIKRTVKTLQKSGIDVSLFVDPVRSQILKAKDTGAEAVEIHTGAFDRASTKKAREREFKRIKDAVQYSQRLGFFVAVGHGLKYHNTRRIAKIKGVQELNIGHSIVAQAVFVGLAKAVREMKRLVT